MSNNLSETKCPYCQSNNFELIRDIPVNSISEIDYIRCSSCKTFLSVATNSFLHNKLSEILGVLDKVKRKMEIS